MPDLLSPDEFSAVYDDAINAGLAQSEMRRELLLGINRRFAAGFTIMANPRGQLKSDLQDMNRVENLPDGSVPLLRWLKNAAEAAYGTQEAKTFKAMAAKIASRSPSAHRALDSAPLDAGGREVTIGSNDLLPYSFFAAGMEAGKSVAKILVPIFMNEQPMMLASGQQSMATGTCWLLTPTLALTNHHVIEARPPGMQATQEDFTIQAAKATAQFEYDFEGAGGDPRSIQECLASDAGLDFALLRLASDSGRKPLSILGTRLDKGGGTTAVNIIQHPNGEPKQIGIRNNLVQDSGDTQLIYFTDTMYGSSGAPVMDDRWRVAALHRGFQPVKNVLFQGKATAVANYGTHVVRLVAKIRAAVAPAVWNEIRAAQPEADRIEAAAPAGGG